jgi:hypothetical protein
MSDDFEFADDAVAEAFLFIQDDSRPPTNGEVQLALACLA